jgi:anti-sigma factor RsiW
MSCEQTRLYLHAYLDDELGVADAIRYEQHLAECVECQTAQSQSLALRKAIRGADLYYKPTQALAARVNTAVRHAAKPGRNNSLQWLAVAAAIIVTIGLALLLTMRNNGPVGRQELLARAVVDSHVRSLQASHLVDVPSSDHHTVKPWFQGKLDFSPPVPDLAAQGWLLEGGRLDYIDGKPVAALVYERRKHQINVFLWPADQDEPVAQQTSQGYQVIHGSAAGMTYWVISDLNATELMEFARLLLHGR